MSKPSILYITDLYYKANNRIYNSEDIFLTSQLKDDFDLLICHPLHTLRFEESVDLVVLRNSGPAMYYKKQFDEFFSRIKKIKLLAIIRWTGAQICLANNICLR